MGVAGIVDCRLKASVTISDIYADVIAVVVGHRQIQNAIIIKVAVSDASWGVSAEIVDRRLESSVTVAQENRETLIGSPAQLIGDRQIQNMITVEVGSH